METMTLPDRTDADLDIEAAVRDAILNLRDVRPTSAEVEVEVHGGRVTLSGVVQSPMAAVEVERAAADVPGVTGVTSHLIDDGTLSRSVAWSLATDARTRSIPPGYEVTSVFGHVTLVGQFTAEQARSALEVCQAVRGVHSANIKNLN